MANETQHEKSSTGSQYWDNRYLNNETGWDMKQVSPPLKAYIDSLENKNLKIVIPGCGNAYEAEYLLEKGFKNVTLIDFSKVVTRRLKDKYKDKPISIVNENFFDHRGKYDLILEQTFFCALDPSLREKYVEKCFNLLNNGGKIAGVLFNKKFSPLEPPFIATDEEYRKLFDPFFTFLKFDNCNNSVPPRMGYELFFEFEKKQRGS
ncbi:MAG TPA: methyltransferase domain-containing protein [Hanamia sp.]|nr:methyltransferase domain-containing protein [Hanamia sp.]